MGNLVLTKPGLIHWVNATGYAIHYSYNIFRPTV